MKVQKILRATSPYLAIAGAVCGVAGVIQLIRGDLESALGLWIAAYCNLLASAALL